MADPKEILFFARPTIRRAMFYAVVYAAAVLFGRIKTDLDPRFNPVWWSCFGILVALLFVVFLRRWTTTFIINREEVQWFSGILSRKAVIVPLERITNAQANQSFLDRILGIVTLQIDSPGGNAKEMVMKRILKSEAIAATEIVRELRGKAPPTASSLADGA